MECSRTTQENEDDRVQQKEEDKRFRFTILRNTPCIILAHIAGKSTDRTPCGKWIPFFGHAGEDIPTTYSSFDDYYFEACLPHLKTVGGMRTFITRKVLKEEELTQEDSPTLMFLYLRFSLPSDDEEKEHRMKLASFAAERLIDCWGQSELHGWRVASMAWVFIAFFTELMPRIREALKMSFDPALFLYQIPGST